MGRTVGNATQRNCATHTMAYCYYNYQLSVLSGPRGFSSIVQFAQPMDNGNGGLIGIPDHPER